jgi:hypothetical protein
MDLISIHFTSMLNGGVCHEKIWDYDSHYAFDQ